MQFGDIAGNSSWLIDWNDVRAVAPIVMYDTKYSEGALATHHR